MCLALPVNFRVRFSGHSWILECDFTCQNGTPPSSAYRSYPRRILTHFRPVLCWDCSWHFYPSPSPCDPIALHLVTTCYFFHAGGYDGTSYLNTVRCYDPIAKLWSDIGQMTTKRCFNSLINYKDHLFAIAGFDGVRRLHTVEKYCSSTNQWIRIASLSAARSDSVAVCCGRYIYVIGGYSGNSLRSVEYYDGIIWRYASPLISRRSGAGAVILPDGRIFVMGGYDGTARLMTTEFYDVKTDAWTHGPSMHAARSNFATCVVHGYVYVIGGYTGQSTLDEVERYDTSTISYLLSSQCPKKYSCFKVTKIRL